MISIDVKPIPYDNGRLQQIEDTPLSDEFNMQLEEAFAAEGLPKDKGYQSLLQKSGNIKPHAIDLTNLQNMGYEGSFWFGSPSQEM